MGSELTAPIYRQGTIGRAKDDLEATARRLGAGILAAAGGTAVTSVNCAAVTMSSLSIPGISQYLSLLRAAAGDRAQSPIRQSVRLWDHPTGRGTAPTDGHGRLRLDEWELAATCSGTSRPAGRSRPSASWPGSPTLTGSGASFWRLYGFGVAGVDYGRPAEVEVPWPAPPDPGESAGW